MAMSADICGFCFIKSVFGFCENCSQRLCDTCFTVHKKASGHITFPLDKTLADTDEHVVLKSDINEEKCSTHNTENLSFYCENHDKPVCGRCIIMNHSSCLKNVIDLHEISFNEHQTNEHLSRLDEVKEEIQEVEASVMEKMKTVDDLKETYLTGIKIFRKKLDDRLNMLQSKIESAGKSKCDAIVDKLQNIGDECKEINTRIDKKRTMMEELLSNKHDRSLFIISKGLDKEIKEINAVLRQAKLDNHVVQFGFVENSSLDRTLHNDIQEFGTLQEACDGSEMEPEITPEVEEEKVSVTEDIVLDTGWRNYSQQYPGPQPVTLGDGDPCNGKDSQAAAWAAYCAQCYAQYVKHGAGGQYGQQPQQPQQMQHSKPQPIINPATGQPDYSLEWAEYYRSQGMYQQAQAILAQQQQQQAEYGQQQGDNILYLPMSNLHLNNTHT